MSGCTWVRKVRGLGASSGGFGGVDAWTAGERVAHRPLLQRSSSKPPAVISVNWLVAPGCGELSEAAERASASSAARRAGLRTLRACASKGSESPAAEIVSVKAPAPEKPEKLEARLEDREPPASGWGWPRVFLLLWCSGALHASPVLPLPGPASSLEDGETGSSDSSSDDDCNSQALWQS